MKILLPIDESSCSAAAVDTIIHEYDPAWTEVCVVHAVERNLSVPAYAAFAEGPSAADTALATYEPECIRQETIASKTVARLRAAGFKVTADIRIGSPVGVILDCSAAWNPDVIVMGSRNRHGISRLIHGSVSHDILRAAGCDVVIVKPPKPETIH
jgi:nucleotide-binding universal stress UspA family protein